jgi:hypothetical protein
LEESFIGCAPFGIYGQFASNAVDKIHFDLAFVPGCDFPPGSTAIAIIFSPIGKRSGAHFNPAVTLTYSRLGKIAPWDAAYYIALQFVGGIAGVLVALLVLGNLVAHRSVNYSSTLPGQSGPSARFWPN